MKVAGAPSYEQVVSGADPSETPKITEALDKEGVKYEVRNNGTAIAVEKSQVGDAKVALAGAGLPGHAQPGFELMEKQKLGASDFQQKVTYQRALEGEIARTVEGVQGVSSAQVNLVLADEQLFQDEQQPARASVLLTTDGNGIEPGSVRGIASLVTSSVKGLKSENVSITDQTGALLWPKQGDGDGSVMTKQQAEQRYAQATEAKLNAMLIQTLGPDKGRVQVSADVNADQTTRDRAVLRPAGHADQDAHRDRGARGRRRWRRRGRRGGQHPAVRERRGRRRRLQLQPRGRGDRAGGRQDGRAHEGRARRGQPPERRGRPRQDASRPATSPTLQDTLATAAGIDAAARRHDHRLPGRLRQARGAPRSPAPRRTRWAWPSGSCSAWRCSLFLFFVTRHLRRHENDQLEPVWLREIETPTPLAELEADARPDAASRRRSTRCASRSRRSSSSTLSASLSRCAPG